MWIWISTVGFGFRGTGSGFQEFDMGFKQWMQTSTLELDNTSRA
jgi:hypothetical protein